MSAPQAIKDALLAALDEAYDADARAHTRVVVPLGAEALLYSDEPHDIPAEATYKIAVDATDGEVIHLRISVRIPRYGVWPL